MIALVMEIPKRVPVLSAAPAPTGSKIDVGRRSQSFEINKLEVVDQTSGSWNQMLSWLRQLDRVRLAAAESS